MANVLDFLLNYVLVIMTGLAVLTILEDIKEEKKKRAIPALVCIAAVYFRIAFGWSVSENGTLSVVDINLKDPILGFLVGPTFRSILLGLTLLACIWWKKPHWIKNFLPFLFKK